MKFGAILLFAILLLSGCGRRETRVEHGNRERILHIDNASEPQDIDPQIVTGVPEHRVITALLEGLVTEDPVDLHPIAGVAERWDRSPDQLVYTFYLRTNAFWSNGDRVTAQDFVRSYRRILAPSLASEYAYMLYVMKGAEDFNNGKLKDFDQVGVHALDDFTLRITLNGPTPYFLSLLNHYSWFPVHIPTIERYGPLYERGNRWTRPGHFVGNGPFTLTEWKVNYIIHMKKSPTYWDADRVHLKEIYFYPFVSMDTGERAFRSGQTHTVYALPLTKTDHYRKNHPQWLRIDPYLATYFYLINVTKPPLNNPKVRKALALAIDRESLVKNVTRGGQLPAYNFTPPNTAGYTARARIGGDHAMARRLLAEAGYPGGKGLPPIEILFNTLESHRALAEAIQQMWKETLEIDARLVNQEWKVFQDSQRTGNFMVSRFGWTGDYPDPNSFLDIWVTGGGNNRAFWSNAEYDRLIREAGLTADATNRLELFQRAEGILMEELPIIPIYFYTRVYAVHPSVQGWYTNVLDEHPYKHVWLDPTKN